MTAVLKYCFGLPEVAFDAGDVLISQGGEHGPLYILVNGCIEVLREGIEIARCDQPGAIFGEMAALLDVPHTATVRAATDACVHVIESPKQFLESRPQIALHVATLLAHRLSDTTGYLVEARSQSAGSDCPLDEVERAVASIAQRQSVASPGT